MITNQPQVNDTILSPLQINYRINEQVRRHYPAISRDYVVHTIQKRLPKDKAITDTVLDATIAQVYEDEEAQK